MSALEEGNPPSQSKIAGQQTTTPSYIRSDSTMPPSLERLRIETPDLPRPQQWTTPQPIYARFYGTPDATMLQAGAAFLTMSPLSLGPPLVPLSDHSVDAEWTSLLEQRTAIVQQLKPKSQTHWLNRARDKKSAVASHLIDGPFRLGTPYHRSSLARRRKRYPTTPFVGIRGENTVTRNLPFRDSEAVFGQKRQHSPGHITWFDEVPSGSASASSQQFPGPTPANTPTEQPGFLDLGMFIPYSSSAVTETFPASFNATERQVMEPDSESHASLPSAFSVQQYGLPSHDVDTLQEDHRDEESDTGSFASLPSAFGVQEQWFSPLPSMESYTGPDYLIPKPWEARNKKSFEEISGIPEEETAGRDSFDSFIEYLYPRTRTPHEDEDEDEDGDEDGDSHDSEDFTVASARVAIRHRAPTPVPTDPQPTTQLVRLPIPPRRGSLRHLHLFTARLVSRARRRQSPEVFGVETARAVRFHRPMEAVKMIVVGGQMRQNDGAGEVASVDFQLAKEARPVSRGRRAWERMKSKVGQWKSRGEE